MSNKIEVKWASHKDRVNAGETFSLQGMSALLYLALSSSLYSAVKILLPWSSVMLKDVKFLLTFEDIKEMVFYIYFTTENWVICVGMV